MINDQFKLRQFLLLLTVTIILIACQEDSVNDEVDLIDQDMIAATEMADEYLRASAGRVGVEKSITVLKLKDDKLLFHTNRDELSSYTEVNEQTITAIAEPGEYIFWYSGSGLSDLEAIEFDEDSQLRLIELPYEVKEDRMWMIEVPEDLYEGEDGDILLKYDIIYDFKGNEGSPIRLDPKIKVAHETVD